MPDKTKRKLQQKVSRLINIYLINSLSHGFNTKRANRRRKYDWDLLGLIYELRRGIYGGLREQDIQDFLYQQGKLKTMRGLMGFYCLIEDPQVLKYIDGWVVNIVRRACVERRRILRTKYRRNCPTPSNEELILGTWFDQSAWRDENDNAEDVEVTFPSLGSVPNKRIPFGALI